MDPKINRPDRTGRKLHGLMETFELEVVINWLQDEAEYKHKGRDSLTLVKNPALRVLMLCLQKGEVLHQHRAPGPITVQILRGQVRFTLEPGENSLPVLLNKGELLVLEETRLHELVALKESIVLLTLVNLKHSTG
jgi:quercetin dioxygenase-like cupin family protein